MKRYFNIAVLLNLVLAIAPKVGRADQPYDMLATVERMVSGERALEYTARLWRYDRWFGFSGFRGSANEARSIMKKRGFDEAEIVDTPANGVTRYGTWTNLIGWEARQGTLEVIEPSDIPDEYRFLCNYQSNPISLNQFSCPTPPG